MLFMVLAWLGIVAFVLMLVQISLGIGIVMTGKKPYYLTHTKINWIILFLVALVHGIIGVRMSFFG